MPDAPTGTVTFLFTDIEGSTRLWEEHPEAMQSAVQRHDALLREAIEANNGYVFKTVGDAFCASFPIALDALTAALAAHLSLQAQDWPSLFRTPNTALRIRVGLHTGTAHERDVDYFGPALNRVARLMSAGHGGQTLLSNPTYELVRDHLPAGVQLKDMGEHHLKDLFRPEHIFQLIAPELPQDFPPLKTLDNRANNLPIQPTPLVGREEEVAAVERLLGREDVHLVTLTGPGGTGKTRLALQAGADLVDRFADGVFFVNLAPITDPGLVISEIAQTLGVRESGSRPLIDALKDYLRDKKLLLILDNFEQILLAAPHLSDLLSQSPGLKILVTSRARLQLRGEHEYSVPPLKLPDTRVGHLPSLERLTQYEAVRLFIERATDLKPDFYVTNDNAPAVAEICVRVDGLPLAIELAAARIKLLAPQAMLARLQNRLKVLTGGAKDLPARQQTLRSTIEWSYDLLNDEEKTLFRRLAVFVGGATLEAIEAVCNADGNTGLEVLDVISSLIDKSLLRQEEGAVGEPRFVMLETIHEFAMEKLGNDAERDRVCKWHAIYFLTIAEAAENAFGTVDAVTWLARLEDEQDNLRTALSWLLEVSETDMALRMAANLNGFWIYRDHVKEGMKWLEAGLAKSPTTGTLVRANALRAAGKLADLLGDYSLEEALAKESLTLYRELGNSPGIARALERLAESAFQLGNFQAAAGSFQGALEIWRALGDDFQLAQVLNGMGMVSVALRHYELAERYLTESLDIAQRLGHTIIVAYVTSSLAFIALWRENYGQARALLLRSLAMTETIGQKSFYAQVLMGFAGLEALPPEGGNPERAARLLAAADTLFVGADISLDFLERRDFDELLAAAHAQLPDTEWRKAWNEGCTFSVEQAIVYALANSSETVP